jgi:hypothetical protein
MADGIYSPLSSGHKFGHTDVNRPFPSGGIAVASGEANYADFDQHNTVPASVYNPSGVIFTPPLDTFGSDIRGQSGLEPITHFSNSSKHKTIGIEDFGAFNGYIHYTPNPEPSVDLFGNIMYAVIIPKFIPRASAALWNGYVKREPKQPDKKEDES